MVLISDMQGSGLFSGTSNTAKTGDDLGESNFCTYSAWIEGVIIFIRILRSASNMLGPPETQKAGRRGEHQTKYRGTIICAPTQNMKKAEDKFLQKAWRVQVQRSPQ